eukprot:1922596-Pyramimonas_sp.AAC.1
MYPKTHRVGAAIDAIWGTVYEGSSAPGALSSLAAAIVLGLEEGQEGVGVFVLAAGGLESISLSSW